ncbi:Crp/Fnr family transcriptional regulator [Robertmurraya andreesenii]|uniref:CRP/FNR family transcriptional regulator n=1 Tax=Anoxybacillus andreesenii TaxID=1325932 RepID=A0ABT9V2T6_9BACL|nr:Crp/Fnr family transcriptional regulator [Robertmurraya andreesenii]MDQ0155175.1 CRP/FNR family transcriptional regulator [Robertmurraya andreesenii]
MRQEDIKEVLSKFTLFRDLNDQELQEIVNISISREFKKGTHVFMQDDNLENVYFIYDGKIKIYKSDIAGKEQIVNFLKNGEMFPHVGFFRKGGYPAFSEVIEDATLVVVPISQFENVLIENPELCIKVFKVLGEKIVDLQERLEAQVLNNTYEQIIKLLVRLGRSHGQELEDGTICLKGEFTNKDLANMIGTTRETVSRTLTKMKKEGKIEVDAKGNMLFDPDELLDEII